MDAFLIMAAFSGVGLSLATGPLGAFVVWRRMAYFGDAVAHAAILGVALSLGFSISILGGTLAVGLGVGVLASGLTERRHSMDAALGVLAHAGLALGLVALSFLRGVRVDLDAYLFGDILTIGPSRFAMIWGGALGVLALLVWRWSALVTATVSKEIAVSVGINPRHEQRVLTIALALVVAISLKVVGALLIGALLVIPAAAARSWSATPEAMAARASAIGALSCVLGVALSLATDAPTGPSIVTVAAAIFVLSLLVGQKRR